MEQAGIDGEGDGGLDAGSGKTSKLELVLIEALNKIRTTVVQTTTAAGQGMDGACRYSLPATTGGQDLDPAKVNVQIIVDGAVRNVGQVPDMASCQKVGDKGWYYDDPSRPKTVNFCHATCSSLGAADGGLHSPTTAPRVDVLTGCATEAATGR